MITEIVPPAVHLGRLRGWLVTSMVLQNGGWYGTTFNLVTLALTLRLVQPVVAALTVLKLALGDVHGLALAAALLVAAVLAVRTR